MTGPMQNPGLRVILKETLQALERLEADRLDEIALSCKGLAGVGPVHNQTRRNQTSTDYRRVEHEMDIFKRLVEHTNANLKLLRLLSTIRGAQLEYGRVPAKMCPTVEVEYGND